LKKTLIVIYIYLEPFLNFKNNENGREYGLYNSVSNCIKQMVRFFLNVELLIKAAFI